jgi:hypothetical protein
VHARATSVGHSLKCHPPFGGRRCGDIVRGTLRGTVHRAFEAPALVALSRQHAAQSRMDKLFDGRLI